ncbi:MAG: UdgX family uracil-DNA binding protein [Alphaproteobacteria bacterium]|nr:UdgX family uracil-DNA binding protein [Alphaproteobacteria bacterium]
MASAGTEIPNLAGLKAELESCRRCALYRHATQAVPGEGPARAAVMLVGEQPGNDEDFAGRPFVGPAGRVLDAALHEAGIDRKRLYVTNAVKHFKFEPRGKRRLHKKPDSQEIAACHYWNEIERALIRPDLVVALGATAAQSLMGKSVTISRTRGRIHKTGDADLLVTVHPSFLLRIPDESDKRREYRAFVADLKLCHPYLSR